MSELHATVCELVVERDIRIRSINGIMSRVELKAPSGITERRAFIARLREWADDLETEADLRQESIDKINAMEVRQ